MRGGAGAGALNQAAAVWWCRGVIRCYNCDGSRPAPDRLEEAQFCCLLEELASRCPLLNPQFRSILVNANSSDILD